MGWVFQGNPAKFDIDDYLSRYPDLVYWRTPRYSSKIAIHDRVFIWRSGEHSGAIAIGTVIEAPVPRERVAHREALGDDLWIAEPPPEHEMKTGLRIDDLRLSVADGMIPRSLVVDDAILGRTALIRTPTGTVFELSNEATIAMERLWGVGAPLPTSSPSAEGERRLRSHFVRERSARLRADKLISARAAHGRLRCEICSEEEANRYPDSLAERVFEVHHRTPLADLSTPTRTTLDALAVLCANCHHSVHATAAVDENFRLLVDHFGQRR